MSAGTRAIFARHSVLIRRQRKLADIHARIVDRLYDGMGTTPKERRHLSRQLDRVRLIETRLRIECAALWHAWRLASAADEAEWAAQRASAERLAA